MRVADASRLAALVRDACRPAEFVSVDAWRASVGEQARDLVGGTLCHVALAPVPGLATLHSPDIDPAFIAEYERDWRMRDPGYGIVGDRRVYSRSHLLARLPNLRDEFLRSDVYGDFYRRMGARDATGIIDQRGRLAQICVFHRDYAPPGFGLNGLRALSIVAPAFAAGVEQIFALAEAGAWAARLVDTLPSAVAVYGLSGQSLHENRAFVRLLTSTTRDTLVRSAIRSLVQRVMREASGMDATSHLVMPAIAIAGLRLSATLAREGAFGFPACVFVVARAESTAISAAGRHARPVPLTAREREVATLLASGGSATDAAHALGVSPHTVRRHLERVYAKLGVHDRAGLVRALSSPSSDHLPSDS